jgi:predicted transport protein
MDQNNSSNNNTNPVPLKNEIKLVDIEVKDENTALNVIVNFLGLAQKRGVFSFDESAKIWECIKVFQK